MRTQQGRGHSGAARLHASHHLISRHSPRSLPATQVKQTRQSPQPSPSDLPHALRSLAFLLPATAATSPCLPRPRAPHGLFPHGAGPTASFPTAPHRPSATTAPCAPRKGEGGGRRGSHLSVGCPAGTPRGCQGAEARPVPHGARPGVRWQQGKRQSPPRLVPGLALQCGAV